MLSMNHLPFEHRSNLGTVFTCARCDFGAPILVEIDRSVYEHPQRLASEVGEFIAWHRTCIWYNLNGFSGYQGLNYQFTIREEA